MNSTGLESGSDVQYDYSNHKKKGNQRGTREGQSVFCPNCTSVLNYSTSTTVYVG